MGDDPLLREPDLSPPPEGDDELRHDRTFESWDAKVGGLRDLANRGIDVLDGLGAGLRRLPEGSLRELLVEPLTGDAGAIRQNAEACHTVRDALVVLAGNQGRLVLWVDPRWGGRAGLAYGLDLGGRALATRALAELVEAAAPVLDEVALTCERLTVEVEGLVVECGEVLGRLVRRLLSRVSGPLGWGCFAVEVATQGMSAITDLVDDATRVLEIVETLLTMQDDVLAWAQERRDRIETLLDLPEMLRAIA
ncbi:hypothetical protein [Nocardioides sp. 1609]|uniref:hypothetical protein n=1 Tax=Nocardioides sp. 1609 TaxID=2508327 RepID=UPI00106F330A|nr:hypothetical protein [Nocardioides sp. 1609]